MIHLDRSTGAGRRRTWLATWLITALVSVTPVGRVAADRVAADRVAADRVAADRVAADRVAGEVRQTTWGATRRRRTARRPPTCVRCIRMSAAPRPARATSAGWR